MRRLILLWSLLLPLLLQAATPIENVKIASESGKSVAKKTEQQRAEEVRTQKAAQARQAAEEQAARERVSKVKIEMVPIGGFSLGKYEVTQGLWQAVMGSNPSEFTACGEDCPVEKVSWNDVHTFLTRLNQLTGKHYRLPTEKEWEQACGSGEYCGGDNPDVVAWHLGNSNATTHKVGLKQPNAKGLYDMSGNVWEWMEDCYDRNCNTGRVLRGGAWGTKLELLRSRRTGSGTCLLTGTSSVSAWPTTNPLIILST